MGVPSTTRAAITGTAITAALVLGSVPGHADPLVPSASFLGEGEDNKAGRIVSLDGDVNGDGYDDLLFGVPFNAPGAMDGAGKAYLVFGRASGWAMDTPLAQADAAFIGETQLDQATCARIAGDLNGDGYDDLAIGASRNAAFGFRTGQVYVILGMPTGWAALSVVDQAAVASFHGEEANDEAGWPVAGIGDVNDDGLDDLAISAPFHDNGSSLGQIYLVFGRTSGWAMDQSLAGADASLVGETDDSGVGSCVAGQGDLNGDGVEDLVAGVSSNDEVGTNAGQAYVLFGGNDVWTPDQSLGAADASFLGEGPGARAGQSVAIAGDVDGDGYDDLLIGAKGHSVVEEDCGAVYLVLGRPSGWSMDTSLANADAMYYGLTEDDSAGESVAGAGDLDGDGLGDILVGVQDADANGQDAGAVYAILGRGSGWPSAAPLDAADGIFLGEQEGDEAGIWVAGGGDVNGDGLVDVLAGAMHNGEVADDAGQAYLFIDPFDVLGDDDDTTGDDDSTGDDDTTGDDDATEDDDIADDDAADDDIPGDEDDTVADQDCRCANVGDTGAPGTPMLILAGLSLIAAHRSRRSA